MRCAPNECGNYNFKINMQNENCIFFYFQMKMMMVERNVNICEYPDDFLTHEKKILCIKIIIKEKKISLSFATSHRKKDSFPFFSSFFFSLCRLFSVSSKAELQYEFFILIKWIKLLFSLLESFSFISYVLYFTTAVFFLRDRV